MLATAGNKSQTPNFTILTNIPSGSNHFHLTDQGNQPILLVFWPIFWYYLLCRYKTQEEPLFVDGRRLRAYDMGRQGCCRGEAGMTMNPRIVLLLAGVILIVSNPCALAHTDVTAEQARNLIDSTTDLIVIDVRERYEYCDAKGHIPGALNYPWSSGVLKIRYEELSTDGPVLVVCRSGGRSNAAANFLDSKGFLMIYDMLGGMSAWQWETAPCKYSGGSGTPDDPYQIATASDLIALGETPEDYDKHFILTADIDLDPNLPGRKVFDKAVIATDMNDANWEFDGTSFTGVFDGNGQVISRLTIMGDSYLGLFGSLGEWTTGAEVRDLGVVDVNIIGGDDVGGLAGRSRHATVAQCYSTGSVSGDGHVGGLTGSNYLGTITASHSTATVAGGGDPFSSYVGGLTGENSGKISRSYSAGTVSGGDYDVGGLVGHNGGAVIDCNSTCSVIGEYMVGGLVGANNGAVFNCYSACSVTGSDYAGGLVGVNVGNMINCYSTGAVVGNEAIGGLVGRNGYCLGAMAHPGYIDKSYSLASAKGEIFVGGLVGDNWAGGDVMQCYSKGAVSGASYVGGLAGDNLGYVTQCYSTGAVSGGGDNVGGLVGDGWWLDISAGFWDTETSGQVTSAEGTGLTTADMQTAGTFLDAGWDFIDETANGTDDIWWILEGQGYPRLYWELIEDDQGQTQPVFGKASDPYPADGAVEVEEPSGTEPFKLVWTAGLGAVAHNVYFGTDLDAVSQSDVDGIHGALIFQNLVATELRLWPLERDKTYYWRIDEVGSDGTILTGDVWSFTTALQPSWWKGRTCFTSDTPVWIDGNLIPISNAVPGQVVRWGDDQNKVEELQVHDGMFTCYDIVLETGNCITVAECHYFMTDSGQWIALYDLKTGTRLKTSKGDVSVTTITKRPKPYAGKVFNLRVKGSDRYLVGKDAIVVRDY
ncbi:MAG: hypothetical protein CEE38_11710 [Planctomycetes bacterium B3_Pla]|nr:MAG: hypothetical protein CEE38_11710 [Planctomycetes bacterium B3_Pla]